MKKNIEKYFLFLFVFAFALSIVNVTPTFAKKEDKKDSTEVDTEACNKKDDTKTGADQYSAKCKEQCTSKEEKFAQFKKDNKTVCDLFQASGGNETITIEEREEIAKLVKNIVEKLNTADETALEAVVPDFTTQESKYEFKLTFNDQLRSALEGVIFTELADRTASYNVLNENTTPTKVSDGTSSSATTDKIKIKVKVKVKVKERANNAIKDIILESFDAPATLTGKYKEKVIKELRNNLLNVDLKGDRKTKDADFTVDNFKATIVGTVGYNLPHELYHSGFDKTLTKAIDDNTGDAAAKIAFVEAYKNYVSKNIKIEIQSDTWEEGQSLEFKVSLNAARAAAEAASAESRAVRAELHHSYSSKDALAAAKRAEAEAAAEIPSLTEANINEIIPVDLSTAEAYNKIKKVFTVTVARISYRDLNVGTINYTGLVPVRVTITPTKQALSLYDQKKLEQLKKVFNQRILALAKNVSDKPINLGATLHTAPAPETLYEAIYNAAVAGLTLTYVQNIITKHSSIRSPRALIDSKDSNTGDILNAKVIAVRKGSEDANAIDILLQLDGDPNYVSGFEKLDGLELSYAHIADPAEKVFYAHINYPAGTTGSDFAFQKNFVAGLVPGTKATDKCPTAPGTFVTILTNNAVCKNLLKITVPTATTADFGIPDGAELTNDAKAAVHDWAARVASVNALNTIGTILNNIKKLTTYFDPDDAHLYASDTIKNQLKTSKNIEGFEGFSLSITHNWPADNRVQDVLATLPDSTGSFNISLLRAIGNKKSVYITKEIIRKESSS